MRSVFKLRGNLLVPKEGPKDNDRRVSHKAPPKGSTRATYPFTDPKQCMSPGS